jgi:drug/metabolite transporter (DMT)-like permease
LKRVDTLHWIAVIQALFVTVLWSSSWVIIKFGLKEIPPLIFAGLRYTIAAIILLGIVLTNPNHRGALHSLSHVWWGRLLVYGLLFYTFTQGTQFLGLKLLPAITVSLLLNFTTMFVVLFAILLLKEIPTRKQLLFVGIALIGVYLYFYPTGLVENSFWGILIVLLGVITNALSSILGRAINKPQTLSPLLVTTVSMGIGSLFLLGAGLLVDGVPALTATGLAYILWLSVLNTALAFTLWNKAMQHLSAVEQTIINSTMLPQITLLALLFLGELPTLLDWVGIALVFISALFVQLFRVRAPASEP